MANQLYKGDVAAMRPFVKDRTPEEPNGIRALGLIHHGLLGQGNAVIEAGDLERVSLHVVKYLLGREVFDHNRDGEGRRPKRVGQMVDGFTRDGLDFISGWGGPVHAGHMDKTPRL